MLAKTKLSRREKSTLRKVGVPIPPPVEPLASGKSPHKEAAEWLDKQVEKKAVNTLVADLTPALAEVLLDRNPDNRKIRQSTVEMYARDMLEGKWTLNGEPIIISDSGELNDGQHRCWAVYQSGSTIKTVFVFGMKRDTMITLDQGMNRRLADFLDIRGLKHSVPLATAANLGFQYIHKNSIYFEGRKKATRQEIAQFIEEFPNLVKSVEFIAPNKLPRFLGGVGFLCFMHWIFSRKNKDKADEFMISFIHGMNLESNSPILVARNRFISDPKNTRHAKAEVMIRAWNAWRTGGGPGTVRVLGGPLPEVVA